jgi:hypothetical protein
MIRNRELKRTRRNIVSTDNKKAQLVQIIKDLSLKHKGGKLAMKVIVEKPIKPEESILSRSSRHYIDENGIIRSNSKRSNMVFKRMLEEEGSERD